MREYHIRSALTVQSCQFVFGRGATHRFPQQCATPATGQQTHKYLSIQASSESISWDPTRALHNFINATHCNIMVRSASIATVQPSLIQFQFLGGKRKKTHLRQQAGTWNFSTSSGYGRIPRQSKHIRFIKNPIKHVVWVKGWICVLKTSLWRKSSKSTNMIFFIYYQKRKKSSQRTACNYKKDQRQLLLSFHPLHTSHYSSLAISTVASTMQYLRGSSWSMPVVWWHIAFLSHKNSWNLKPQAFRSCLSRKILQ